MKIIICKMDVLKIDKAKLFKGEKGTYLDFVMMEKENKTNFGDSRDKDDFMICQSVTKEEREAGKRGAILGNAKYLKRKTEAASAKPAPTESSSEDQDVIPF